MIKEDRQELKDTLRADIYRNVKTYFSPLKTLYFAVFEKNVPIRFLIWFRLAQSAQKRNFISKIFILYVYKKTCIRYNFEISPNCSIGKGLRLPHYAGGIVIHPNAVIGKNCEIMQGVTIGNNIMKSRDKVAVIGDNVILASGSKIIGNVNIGDNVVVGANSVVSKSIEPNMIVGGVPAKVIRENTDPIIINADYR